LRKKASDTDLRCVENYSFNLLPLRKKAITWLSVNGFKKSWTVLISATHAENKLFCVPNSQIDA
jgi:hypothetical protein